jgi:hypothetical protein
VKSHTLNDQQHATVIAALRYYQSNFQTVSRDRDSWIEELATNAGNVEALSDDGVDDLIEHLQFEGDDKLAAFKAVDGGVDGLEDDDPEVCASCGSPTDDGEGYDGLCGNCADMAELHHGRDDLAEEANEAACREDRDDSYAGSGVETMTSSGMTANPNTEDA